MHKSLSERFSNKVNKNGPIPAHRPTIGPCWLWTAAIDKQTGYGMIAVHRNGTKRPLKAHRIAWELANGPIPEGKYILHSCDVRACVNPSHLFLGTQADNAADMCRKKRLGANHIEFETALEIRELYATGNTSYPKLSRQFGISISSVARCVMLETWRPEVHA